MHIHQDTEVTGIDVADGRVRGVRTSQGDIATPVVLNATAGWSTLVAAMAGVRLPIATFPLQAAVTEPVRPFLHAVVVSGTLHVYVSQTDRGELVFGGERRSVRRVLDPRLAGIRRRARRPRARAHAGAVEDAPAAPVGGLCDMTPDFSPIMGGTGVEGFYVDVGWGTYGFKAGPVSGEAMARCIADGRAPEIIEAFGLGRFGAGELVGEKGAAAVGH